LAAKSKVKNPALDYPPPFFALFLGFWAKNRAKKFLKKFYFSTVFLVDKLLVKQYY